MVGLVAFWVCQRLPARTYRALARPLLVVAVALLVRAGRLLLPSRQRDLRTAAARPAARPTSCGCTSARSRCSRPSWPSSRSCCGAPTCWPARARALRLVAGAGHARCSRWSALLFVLVGYNDLGTMLCLLVLFVGLLWAAGVRLRVFAGMARRSALAGGRALLGRAPGERATGWTGSPRSSTRRRCDPPSECYQAAAGPVRDRQRRLVRRRAGQGQRSSGTGCPTAHNDFIFAVIAEELGVVGCVVVLRCSPCWPTPGCASPAGSTTRSAGWPPPAITTWLVGQAVDQHRRAWSGLLPITGLPLPFISDGGSALVVTLAAVGMLASFARAEPDAARALHARPPARWVRLLWAPLPPLPRGPAQPRRASADAGGQRDGGTAARAPGRSSDGERRR